jgi:hypothetical protein
VYCQNDHGVVTGRDNFLEEIVRNLALTINDREVLGLILLRRMLYQSDIYRLVSCRKVIEMLDEIVCAAGLFSDPWNI